MLEVIKVIAMLCQISGGPNPKMVAVEQNQCHQYYTRCIYESSAPDYGKRLKECVLGKKSPKTSGDK